MDKDKFLKDVERGLYYHSLETGQNTIDRSTAALSKLFVPEFDTKGIAAFESLPKAYVYFTGDSDIRGIFRPENTSKDLRACMDFTSSTFTYALLNALNLYLSKSYRDFPYHEDILISQKQKVKDFRKINSVQLGYFGDLPDIDPETGDYETLEPYTDTESQYSLSPKGAILWVTRRHILNDSIGLIKGMVKRAARAARMTHAKHVWSPYINNSTCPDGTVWFTSEHGNLGSNALDFTPLVTAITALANMTEPGSGERIGLDLPSFKWHLIVPIALWDLAVKKNQDQYYYSADDLTTKVANPCYRLFGDHNERIITCPFLTDTNDWGIVRDPEDVPIIEMSYLNGNEDPEFILEEGQTDTHVFQSDKFGYKIRHEYGGTLSDYRGGYKSIVP